MQLNYTTPTLANIAALSGVLLLNQLRGFSFSPDLRTPPHPALAGQTEEVMTWTAEQIREWRLTFPHPLTQVMASKLIGVSDVTWASWESGRRPVPAYAKTSCHRAALLLRVRDMMATQARKDPKMPRFKKNLLRKVEESLDLPYLD